MAPDTRWTPDDELNDGQLKALDGVWEAVHREGVPEHAGAEVEALVRAGDLWHAHRRLAQLRRAARAAGFTFARISDTEYSRPGDLLWE